MVSIKTAVLFSLLACVFGQTDWCNISTCSRNQHIACNNNGLFSSICQSPEEIEMTDWYHIRTFLDAHNYLRNMVASGELAGFPPARRMAKLTWNNQLAKFAELNTKQCRMNHDACHNTATLKFSGQNLGMISTSETYGSDEVLLRTVMMWFNEHKNANVNNINRVGTPSNGVIGHFTAMMTERTTQIGCAMSTFKTKSGGWTMNNYLVACNYDSTNMGGWPVYKTGPKASGCIGGPDETFPGLCKTSEKIDPNSNN